MTTAYVLVRTGVRYCIEHDGVIDVDQVDCDFAMQSERACKPRQLVYRRKRRRP